MQIVCSQPPSRVRPLAMFTRDEWLNDPPNERVDGCPPMGGVSVPLCGAPPRGAPGGHLGSCETEPTAAALVLGEYVVFGSNGNRRWFGFTIDSHGSPDPRSVRRCLPGRKSADLPEGVRSVARASAHVGLAQDHAGLVRPGLHGPLAGVRRVVSGPVARGEPGQHHRGRPRCVHQQPPRAEVGGARQAQPAQGGGQVHAAARVAPVDPHRRRARGPRARHGVLFPEPFGRHAASVP